jgi:hypothetical protein
MRTEREKVKKKENFQTGIENPLFVLSPSQPSAKFAQVRSTGSTCHLRCFYLSKRELHATSKIAVTMDSFSSKHVQKRPFQEPIIRYLYNNITETALT